MAAPMSACSELRVIPLHALYLHDDQGQYAGSEDKAVSAGVSVNPKLIAFMVWGGREKSGFSETVGNSPLFQHDYEEIKREYQQS
jgi:hypothetical protein